jgi:hypothetical protein
MLYTLNKNDLIGLDIKLERNFNRFFNCAIEYVSMETYVIPNESSTPTSNRVTIEPSSSNAKPFENREAISNATVQDPNEFDLKILPEFSDIIICYSTMKGIIFNSKIHACRT